MPRKSEKVSEAYYEEVEAFYFMNAKVMTPKQYAEMRGCTVQNVTKHLRNRNILPGVSKVKRCSRFYLFEMV